MEKYNFGEDEYYLLSHNIVGATNMKQLEIAEQFAFTVRALQFETGEYQLSAFDYNQFLALHKHLFQDIYDFAGMLRDVQLAKGNTRFCQMQFIQSELQSICDELVNEPVWIDLKMAAERLAYFKSELNIIHPFREGNGRTIRLFIHNLARHKGYEWDYINISQEDYMKAMIHSVTNIELLYQLFLDNLMIKK